MWREKDKLGRREAGEELSGVKNESGKKMNEVG